MVNNQCLRKPVHTVPKSGTEAFPKNDDPRLGAASLRYRNRAETIVLMCEQKPHPVLLLSRGQELALKSRFPTLTRGVSYISFRYYHSTRTIFLTRKTKSIKIVYFWVKTGGGANTLLGSLQYRFCDRASTVACHAYCDFRLLSRGEDRGLLCPPLVYPLNL